MKKLLFVLVALVAFGLHTDLNAQKQCTPEQIEACKKVCTPEQIAACKKICGTKTAQAGTTDAVKVVNQAPAKPAACQKASAQKEAASKETPVKLVGLEVEKTKKKSSCSLPCVAAKKE